MNIVAVDDVAGALQRRRNQIFRKKNEPSTMIVVAKPPSPPPLTTSTTTTGINITTATTTKTYRNQLAKWRLITRVIVRLFEKEFREKMIAQRRKEEENNNENGGGGGGDDGEIKKTQQFVKEISNPDYFLQILHCLRSMRYAKNYILSIWSTLETYNRLATRKLYTEFEEKERYDEIEEDSSGGGVIKSMSTLILVDDNAVDEAKKKKNKYLVSRKSDGRLTFSEEEYRQLLKAVTVLLDKELLLWFGNNGNDVPLITLNDAIIRYDNNNSGCGGGSNPIEKYKNFCTFLYVFYMLAITGKRLSDIAELEKTHLRQLSTRGVCVIKIRKTETLGRIEIPEILTTDDNDNGCSELNKRRDVVRRIRGFEMLHEQSILTIPFDRQKKRRALDTLLNRLYRETFGFKKSRGLSFHALRRIYAGYRFLNGVSIERIRENLDHSNRRQTNRYVNNCLWELL